MSDHELLLLALIEGRATWIFYKKTYPISCKAGIIRVKDSNYYVDLDKEGLPEIPFSTLLVEALQTQD